MRSKELPSANQQSYEDSLLAPKVSGCLPWIRYLDRGDEFSIVGYPHRGERRC